MPPTHSELINALTLLQLPPINQAQFPPEKQHTHLILLTQRVNELITAIKALGGTP